MLTDQILTESLENDPSVAIIGMAGRFPGARDIDALWEIILKGQDTICRDGKDDDQDPSNFIRARGLIDNINLFDADFFGFTPSDAARLDPQHRLWLELAHEALEMAGYAHDRHNHVISVFGGCFPPTYLLNNILQDRKAVEEYVLMRQPESLALMVQNDPAFLPTRTAYALGLKGPAVNVQTACSTSLVATAMAVQSLITYESDISLAGGICITIPLDNGYFYHEGTINSRDGYCRPYDAKACGTVFGNGAGVVALKRLCDAVRDRDPILAVIKAAVLNNDGRNKVSFYAPSVDGQSTAIKSAIALADIPVETIGYVEGHGTGTPIGDPIEVEALAMAFQEYTDKKQFCCLGSIKGNIGHLDAAAGVAGLIRAVLALKNKVLPATAHFTQPNPAIDFENTPFFVLSQAKPWPQNHHSRRAAVSSFGIGGTNAHLILEEAPTSGPDQSYDINIKDPTFLLMSAKNMGALNDYTLELGEWMESHSQNGISPYRISDVAHTLSHRRDVFLMRRAVWVENMQDAATALRNPDRWATQETIKGTPKLYFAFPGQGSLVPGAVAKILSDMPDFANFLKPFAADASDLCNFDFFNWFTDEKTDGKAIEKDNARGQLASFCIQAALVRWLEAHEVFADGYLGHSLGEWIAAYAAKILSAEDAVKAVYHRGRLMQTSGPGAALIGWAPAVEIQPFLNESLFLACENAPGICLVSGRPDAIDKAETEFQKAKIPFKRTPINIPVHSCFMDPLIEPFGKELSQITFSDPVRPILSTVTGAWLEKEDAKNVGYWASQMRHPVNFRRAAETLCRESCFVQLEVGFGTTLTTLTREAVQNKQRQRLLSMISHARERGASAGFHKALGNLWACGVDVPLVKTEYNGNFAPLPTYRFQRKSYWIEAPTRLDGTGTRNRQVMSPNALGWEKDDRDEAAYCAPRNDLEFQVAGIFSELLGINRVGAEDHFFELGGDSLMAARLLARLKEDINKNIDLGIIFENPTVEKLASIMRGGRHLQTPVLPLSEGNRERLFDFENQSLTASGLHILDSNHPPVEGAKIGRDPNGNPGWYIEDNNHKGKYTLLKVIV